MESNRYPCLSQIRRVVPNLFGLFPHLTLIYLNPPPPPPPAATTSTVPYPSCISLAQNCRFKHILCITSVITVKPVVALFRDRFNTSGCGEMRSCEINGRVWEVGILRCASCTCKAKIGSSSGRQNLFRNWSLSGNTSPA